MIFLQTALKIYPLREEIFDMIFMLDTNIIIYAKNNNPEGVLRRLMHYKRGDVCISVITMAELEYGAYKSSKPDKNRLALMTFLSGIQVMPFTPEAAREYGLIRSSLEKQGTVIGGNDMLIAAHAKSLDLILVTNNQREFERIHGLKVENWV